MGAPLGLMGGAALLPACCQRPAAVGVARELQKLHLRQDDVQQEEGLGEWHNLRIFRR